MASGKCYRFSEHTVDILFLFELGLYDSHASFENPGCELRGS